MEGSRSLRRSNASFGAATPKETFMHESLLKPGDAVTVRRGALLLPEGRRRLPADCQGKVISVAGKSIKVEANGGFVDDENGFRLVGKFLTFDVSYVYRRDA
jgi:hypothetical protein